MALDFPRAWQIARENPIEQHDPRCSYAQTTGALLCDCFIINKHPDMLRRKLISVRLWVYLFKKRFVSRVEDERKLRTMRPKRKDKLRPKPGDRISLRFWAGAPYRSAQRIIRNSIIKSVSDVVIERGKFPIVNDVRLTATEAHDFARYDGFTDFADMQEWFQHEHRKRRIKLDMIEWYPK